MKKVWIAVIVASVVLGLSMTVAAQEAVQSFEVAQVNAAVQIPLSEEEQQADTEAQAMDTLAVEPLDTVAEDEIDREIENADAMYTYGAVISSADGKIVVLEYDFENDKDIEISYSVDSQTIFQNAGGLADVLAGDEVEIMFLETEGQRLAKMISKTTQ